MTNVIVINGCDFSPDGWFGYAWRVCCDAHDLAYSVGGDSIMRLAADLELGRCIGLIDGTITGVAYMCVVASLGWLFYRYDWLRGKNIVETVQGWFRHAKL